MTLKPGDNRDLGELAKGSLLSLIERCFCSGLPWVEKQEKEYQGYLCSVKKKKLFFGEDDELVEVRRLDPRGEKRI